MSKKKFTYLLLFLLAGFFTGLKAQFSIQGKVTDSATGNPLSFVNIIEITSGKGMVTDIDGHFSLKNIFPDDTLQISFVGYQTKTIPGRELQGKRFLSVSMDKRS
ncbi:MAG: carboxypeptidase-like regulatory domain-containing protein, partial [Bacteroidales bacterium]